MQYGTRKSKYVYRDGTGQDRTGQNGTVEGGGEVTLHTLSFVELGGVSLWYCEDVCCV